MSLEEIKFILIMFGGEMIGNSAFFMKIFSGRAHGGADEKRKLMLMPFCSFMISFAAIGITCGLWTVGKELYYLLIVWFPDLEPGLAATKDFLVSICQKGYLSSLTYVSVFAVVYSLFRGSVKKLARSIGESLLRWKDEFGGIYVRDSLGTKYVLSERWEMIYHCICTLTILNIAVMGFVHTFYPETLKSILNVTIRDMFPWMFLMPLIETAGYLSAEKRKLWQWLTRRKDSQAADCSLNIVTLESAMEKYAIKTGSGILKRMRSHQYDFPNKSKEYIESRRMDKDAAVQYLLDYIEKEISRRDIPLHTVDSAIRLIKGENLFIANSFYRDLDVSVFFPVFMTLLKNEKVLVMVEDNGNLKEIVEWIRQGVESIQALNDFWTVEELRPMVDSADVGVLAFQEICKGEQLVWCRSFLDRVSFVVVLEASNLLTAGQDVIMSLSSKVGRKMDRCTWMLTENNAESMIDLYSHLLDKEFLYVSATPYYAKEALVVYWNTEGEDGRAWPPMERYVGMEAAIAAIAGQERIGKLHWYGEEMMPVKDLNWLWGQYYENYQQAVKSDIPYQMLIDENIEMAVSGGGNSLRKQQFIITEDENFNLFEKGRQYATRGTEKVCVCILSPNYLLRDYMKANYRIMESDPKYIPQFTVEHVDSKRNIALRILRRLLEEPVSGTELKNTLSKVEGFKDTTEPLEKVLKEKVSLILPGVKDPDIIVTHRNYFSEQSQHIEREDYYEINDEDIKREFRMCFSQAIYIDETGNARHISKMILGDHLDQKYAKGQFVVFGGKYYEIVGKTTYNGAQALRVKRASDLIYRRKYYRMCRKYMVTRYDSGSSDNKQSAVLQNHYIYISKKTIDFTAETFSYVETSDWGKIKGIEPVILDERDKNIREYNKKQVLMIRLKDENEKATLIMGAFLKEIFCTLYPQHFHLLDVAVDYDYYGEKMNKELEVVISSISMESIDEKEDKRSLFIIEDSREDMGLLRSIERNVHKILKIQENYMTWSVQNERNYFSYE